MKKIKLMPIFLLICLLAAAIPAPQAHAAEPPALTANAVLLLETETGQVFYSRNADVRVSPASVTKIMTVLLAVEACEAGIVALTDQITVPEGFNFDLSDDSSTAYLKVGEVLTLEQLMYLALVSSANDACNVIAGHVGGSVQGFVTMMNNRARELGCKDTSFANTHGLTDDQHYTTAWDLSLIAREAVSHGKFAEIWRTRTYEVPATNMTELRSVVSTNALLGEAPAYTGNDYFYEYATGGKTGFTNAAGHCLLSTATKKVPSGSTLSLMAVVLGATVTELGEGRKEFGHFTDSLALYEWGFDSFDYVEILSSTEVIQELPVELASEAETVSLRPQSSIFALMDVDTPISSFKREIKIESVQKGEPLQAPIVAGAVLGEISISRDGVDYGRVPLVAATRVELSKMNYIKLQIQETLDSTPVKVTFWVIVALLVVYLLLVIRYRVLRLRHVQSVRAAKRRRASNVADIEARRIPRREQTVYDYDEYEDEEEEDDYPDPVSFNSQRRRTSVTIEDEPSGEPEIEFFSNGGETDEDLNSFFDEIPSGNETYEEKDYFEEFFGKK